MKSFALPMVLAAVLCGCATSLPPEPAPPAPPPTPAQRVGLAEALAVERQWLASWFRGTPVLVAQLGDGAVTVEVPREFCFDAGRSRVKPALAAVLNKVAESLVRLPQAHVVLIAAPEDAAGSAQLGLQRAAQVHDYLRSRGVPAVRLGKPSAAANATVQLRLEGPPAL